MDNRLVDFSVPTYTYAHPDNFSKPFPVLAVSEDPIKSEDVLLPPIPVSLPMHRLYGSFQVVCWRYINIIEDSVPREMLVSVGGVTDAEMVVFLHWLRLWFAFVRAPADVARFAVLLQELCLPLVVFLGGGGVSEMLTNIATSANTNSSDRKGYISAGIGASPLEDPSPSVSMPSSPTYLPSALARLVPGCRASPPPPSYSRA